MKPADTNLTKTARPRYIGKGERCLSLGERRVLCYLRESKDAPGIWTVRVEIGRTERVKTSRINPETGKPIIAGGVPIRRRERLGFADDVHDADGKGVLSYEQAKKLAQNWQPAKEEPKASGCTFEDAIHQYRDFDGKKGDKVDRNKKMDHARLRRHVLRLTSKGKPRKGKRLVAHLPKPAPQDPPIAFSALPNMQVNDLTREILEGLRKSFIRDPATCTEKEHKASQASASRNWNSIRSCLENAKKHKPNGIKSADAWRDIKNLGKVGNKREASFTIHDMPRYIARMRQHGHHAEADVFEAWSHIGSRPGEELMSLRVRDFNARSKRIAIPRRSETVFSKSGERLTVLTEQGVAFFQRITAGRSQNAPLLSPDGTTFWSMRKERKHFKAVWLEAGAPEDAIPYHIRHAYASEWTMNGEDREVISGNIGCSAPILKDYYAKWEQSRLQQQIQKTAPKLALDE